MGLFDLLRSKGPRCPRDATHLQRITRNGSNVDQCPKCNGIWIEARQLRKITDSSALAQADQWAGNYAAASGFKCPACEGKCVGTFLEEFSVHTCVACHGAWLDATEVTGARQSVSVMSGARGPELRAFLARL